MITEKEKEIIDISAKLWNDFLLLPEQHPDDISGVRFHVHAIQNIILGRSAQREMKNIELIEVSLMTDGTIETGYKIKE